MLKDVEFVKQQRPTKAAIHPLIHSRWSPRSMTGEGLDDEDLLPLFEAARLAPSSYNEQPWRLIYSCKKDPSWQKLFETLVDFNKLWCKNAGAFILLLSKTHFANKDKPSKTHSFDTGAAWMSLALEGAAQGLVVHAMEGFDYAKAHQIVNTPTGYKVEVMIAVGKPASKQMLDPSLQDMEIPSTRKNLEEICYREHF